MMALGGWCCCATHSRNPLLLHTLSAALEEKKVIADGAAAANGADGYQKPPPRVMICNRGEIARRVIRTANQHGLETVAIYTQVGGWFGVLPTTLCRVQGPTRPVLWARQTSATNAAHMLTWPHLPHGLLWCCCLSVLRQWLCRLTPWPPTCVRPSTRCTWAQTHATTQTRRSCCRCVWVLEGPACCAYAAGFAHVLVGPCHVVPLHCLCS